MRLAILADIHGNARALDAVLADVSRRCVARVVNLGDGLYGPFDPRPVAEHLIEAGWPTVAGNEDRILVEAVDGSAASRTARFTLDQLDDRHIEWLRVLPRTRDIEGIALAFHGTPNDDARCLLTHPTQDGSMRPVSEKEVAAELVGIDAPLILCAHDHMPRGVELADGRTVVNPGSVGCPAYSDDTPIPHAVENGTPHARYAIVTSDEGLAQAELVAVPFDWNAAADEARGNGFPDWSHWLRTGRVR
ncbi:metallophosphatase family protein [Candidatus Bipolaricaulota bacterium]|nr:metallophosphatase family protein [Candidatus Bipolaricaulota bacterium]